jgi:hypothetical protein
MTGDTCAEPFGAAAGAAAGDFWGASERLFCEDARCPDP